MNEKTINALMRPTVGQRFQWQGITYRVTRVSQAGGWADIHIEGPGGWSKRQPLPLPSDSKLVIESDADRIRSGIRVTPLDRGPDNLRVEVSHLKEHGGCGYSVAYAARPVNYVLWPVLAAEVEDHVAKCSQRNGGTS